MKYIPAPYQAYCTQRIVDTPRLALWLKPGYRKTSITLTAIEELKYHRFALGNVLVVAPKKVAEATWQKEAHKWDHTRHLRFSTVLGSSSQRIRAVNASADIYVINRDNVKWLVDYYRNDWPFGMVVLDEASSFKSHRAQRWKALKSVLPHISRIVELTGTPASHGYTDLWAQVYLLDQGERLGGTIGGYRERYFEPDKRNATTVFSYRPKPGAEEAINRLLSDICVSLHGEDLLGLPDLLVDDIPVVLDTSARKAYDKLERELLLPVDDTIINAHSAGVLTNKLLQLCNGAAYDDRRNVCELHRCKLEALLELLEALEGEHVLLFYAFQHDRDRILRELDGKGLRVRVYQDSHDEDAWNAGQIDVLLTHPASCGYGLNLQEGGHHVIWYGLTWSQEQYEQAVDRLHRSGQTQPVVVHRLVVQDSRDEDVIQVLDERTDAQDRLMTTLAERIKKIRK